MTHTCGVDFGTSNSTVGSVRPGESLLLPLEDGKATLPSVVFFNAEDNTTSFGRAALAEYLTGTEGRLMRSMKSLLGTGLMEGQTEVQGRALPFRDLLAQFLGELKRRGEQAAGKAFSHAVFGRPVHFVDDDATADKLAEDTLLALARKAGFSDVSFQYEPIAAAFTYESGITREELVLVIDIGGGTSDFTLVRLSPAAAAKAERHDDILATGGVHIGGTDFDKYLSLAGVMPELGLGTRMTNNNEVPSSYYFNLATWHTINFAYSQKVWRELQDVYRDAQERDKLARLLKLVDQRDGHWLAQKVEETKIALSDADEVPLLLDRLASDLAFTLQRDAFNGAVAHLISGISKSVTDLLADAGIGPERVDTVFFTGGSSGVPLLRREIASMFPTAAHVEGDLFGSIGAGLAIDAARKFS
ncbi:Hsp70 family protein [Noviherbaspirillum denitrificans]|uniref:Heat-shock protein n=1 Tax=Noviherbaspirillum denitrificans TaxID=1968433 RepID=A0A254TAC8_9BURK|nr:Hsp70 family protein [Noviherbaspirillum denitrificans]OWW19609.1 heat-shock protein [Noviherbaspirillum denitrificans]